MSCRIIWTQRDGVEATITGAYLDAHEAGGAVTLGCGIEMGLVDLGVTHFGQRLRDVGLDDEHLWAIFDDVDRQLLAVPTATLRCPLGEFRIELVRP